MANWLNLRLVVTGYPRDVAAFAKAAGAPEGRIDTRKSSVFTREMEHGEGGDLEADRARVFRRRFRRASYRFQAANIDFTEHFVAVSSRYPRLAFTLVWSDPNGDSHGSDLLRAGRKRSWQVSGSQGEKIFMKHYRVAGVVSRNGEVDYDHPYADAAEWEAFFEMMDVAEGHWDDLVADWLRKRPRRAGATRQPARTAR